MNGRVDVRRAWTRVDKLKALPPQIEFSFHLSEQEVASASDAFGVNWRRCLVPGLVASALSAVGVIVIIAVQPNWWGIDAADWLGMGFGLTAGSLVIASSGKWVTALRRWIVLRQYRRTPTAQGATTYRIYDGHVEVISDLGSAQIRWEGFLKAQEKSGYLVLYTSPILGQIIPLKHLASSDASRLRELVRERIKSPPVRSFWRRG